MNQTTKGCLILGVPFFLFLLYIDLDEQLESQKPISQEEIALRQQGFRSLRAGEKVVMNDDFVYATKGRVYFNGESVPFNVLQNFRSISSIDFQPLNKAESINEGRIEKNYNTPNVKITIVVPEQQILILEQNNSHRVFSPGKYVLPDNGKSISYRFVTIPIIPPSK